MRPLAYAYLAFSQGARGRPLGVKRVPGPEFNFDAYAYRDDDGSIYLTLINKTYGTQAHATAISIQLPSGTNWGAWRRMDLLGRQNIAGKSGMTLGGGSIDQQGQWAGQWKTIEGNFSSNMTIQLSPASATILNIEAAP